MKKRVNKTITKEQIGYFGKPTFSERELEEERIEHDKMDALGIDWGIVCSSGDDDCYTADEREAIKLIYSKQDVPKDLADRIIEYHKQHPVQKESSMIKASPLQIQRLLSIKVKDQ